jgi:predicted amidophosphoribosyltransferase
MSCKTSRISRERKTVKAMINIYCHGKHGTRGELCAECGEVLNYANKRLEKCPFQEGKTTCGKCLIHCYKLAMKEKIRTVMQYAGPRMISRHPILALVHFIDGFRKEAIRHKLKE